MCMQIHLLFGFVLVHLLFSGSKCWVQNNGFKMWKSNASICKVFRLWSSSVSTFCAQRYRILEAASSYRNINLKRLRKPARPDIDNALIKEFISQRSSCTHYRANITSEGRQFGKSRFKCRFQYRNYTRDSVGIRLKYLYAQSIREIELRNTATLKWEKYIVKDCLVQNFNAVSRKR